jgi:hypothetical protein
MLGFFWKFSVFALAHGLSMNLFAVGGQGGKVEKCTLGLSERLR